MLEVTLSTNAKVLLEQLSAIERDRLPSIMRNALNDSAIDARDAERRRIASSFDRPVPFTVNAPVFPRQLRATKEHLTASVGMLRDEARGGTPPSKYLQAEIEGGPRRDKPFERRLRQAGILRQSEHAVPANGVRLNAYGNIPGGLMTAILSQIKAFAEVGFLMNQTARSKKRKAPKRPAMYFIPQSEKTLPRGIYERRGKKIRAVLIFVDTSPRYRPRYAFGDAGRAAVETGFEGHWVKHFTKEFPYRA